MFLMKFESDGLLVPDVFPSEMKLNRTKFYPEYQIHEIEAQGYHIKSNRGRRIRRVADIERRVFAMFKENMNALEIVDQLKIPFETVESLYEIYRNNNLESRYRAKLIKAAANTDED